MNGEKVQEARGRITGTRMQPRDGGLQVETNDQASGTLLGVATTDVGAYVHTVLASGELIGEAQGVTRSENGDVLVWHGRGVGTPTGRGIAGSYRYSLTVRTRSPRWQHLDGAQLVREWDVDEHGNTHGQSWVSP
jgi:hypothetical protein